MSTITLRLQDDEKKLVNGYAKMHGMTVSEFARRSMFDQIEDEFDLRELNEAEAEWEKDPVTYQHDEAWRMIEGE